MKDSPLSAKRRRYDAAFQSEARRLAGENRLTQATARALTIDPKRIIMSGKKKGCCVGRQRLRTAMRRRGLHALQSKTFTQRTTNSTHGLCCAPNRLLDQPKPTQANRVWVSDITYLPLASGDLAYLCAFQDMASKQVVGWHVMATMPEDLITTALQRTF